MPGPQATAMEREALRLCDRYVREVVLGFGLCPWAEPALRAGRVGRAVCLSAAPAPGECLGFFDAFAAASAPAVDIGLLVFPRHPGGRAAFDAFAERVRRADRQRQAVAGGKPVFLVAAFHPDGAQTFAGPDQMVSFVRRTPDPMLQLVRATIIDQLGSSQPAASAEVARRNHDSIGASVEATLRLDGVLRAIRADRDTTYTRLRAGPD